MTQGETGEDRWVQAGRAFIDRTGDAVETLAVEVDRLRAENKRLTLENARLTTKVEALQEAFATIQQKPEA